MNKHKTLSLADLMKKETKGINPMKQREGLDKPSSAFLFNDKQVTIGQQTDNKGITKEITNRQQTDNKEITQNEKRITQGLTNGQQNGYQTDNKRITDNKIEMLVGHERKLLFFIYEECRLMGDLMTSPINNERIRETLNCSMETAKMIVYRLVKKGFIKRQESKTGRGGWTKFSMPKDLYQKLNQITNRQQTDNKQVTQGLTQGLTSPSSSSSLNIINTTTTDAWSEIDITPLEKYGFTYTHVKQIISSNKSSPELLQKSIEYFIYMLENKTQEIREPIGFFMSIMRNEGMIAKPVGYKTQIEKHLELLEQERKEELNRLKKYIEENYETLIRHPSIIAEKEKLFQNGFMTENSTAFKETIRGILVDQLKLGKLSWGQMLPPPEVR